MLGDWESVIADRKFGSFFVTIKEIFAVSLSVDDHLSTMPSIREVITAVTSITALFEVASFGWLESMATHQATLSEFALAQ